MLPGNEFNFLMRQKLIKCLNYSLITRSIATVINPLMSLGLSLFKLMYTGSLGSQKPDVTYPRFSPLVLPIDVWEKIIKLSYI